MKQKGSSSVRQRNSVAKTAKQNSIGGLVASQNGPRHQHEHNHDDEPNPFKVFMLFNVFLGAVMYAVYLLVRNPFYMMSNSAEQPLVQVEDNYMGEVPFHELTKCLLDHPLVVGNDLDGKNVEGALKFVVKFSVEGIGHFRANRNLTCLVPYFERARLPNANAFVLNLLMYDLASDNKAQRKEGIRTAAFAVGAHLDNKIGIKSWRTFLPHQVNVLYVLVPNDMRGGELHLFPFEHGFPKDNQEPIERVKPRTNRMVTFKGNSFHRVEHYQSSTALTLVLVEQYVVPKSYESRLTKYEVENR